MRSCPKLGSLEADAVLGDSCASDLLGELSQGERGAEAWVKGREVIQEGDLHQTLASS